MAKKIFTLLIITVSVVLSAKAQPCSLPGMTPDKAIPVCGTSVFHQDQVTNCDGPNVAQTGCSIGITSSSSFWYKFTCYQTGTLGFLISGISSTDDYDWVLFDITGRNPTDVFSNPALAISINLYGAGSGPAPFPESPTGCRAGASGNVHCEGSANGNTPFNVMPTITTGHDYLLMVTNWTRSTTGYDLTFTGGSASITDPKEPHLLSAKAACDGTTTTIKMNKRMKCNSLTGTGSEFTITPPLANVTAATGFGCTTGFDMDSLTLTLDAPLPPGNYTITIQNGTDGNTIRDNCDRNIPAGESIPLIVYPLLPTPMDSLTKPGCSPDEIQLVFRKNIKCSTIAANGSDFVVTLLSGTTPVTVTGASGNCSADGLTSLIKVKLSAPIQTKGTYEIRLVTGSDGNTIGDECNQFTPAGSVLNFNTKDTVNADFTYNIQIGCQRDTINYFHDGRNEVNVWKWNFDNLRRSTLQNPSIIYATFGQKQTQLIVSNGVCSDTSAVVPIFLDNELNAAFETNAVLCPNEQAQFKDNSIGNIVSWSWDFGNGNTSNLQPPPAQSYLAASATRTVFPRLIVQNNYGCFDTATQKIIIPNSCYIAVPNAFTPNGDGLNDFLYPLNAYKATDLKFRVYNRFGQLLFETSDWTKKWDGNFKGQGVDPATYVWILQYTHSETGKRVEQKGTTILIR
ncbi:MAG TPA: gliding motility-associated C-terminal domain-containing protein [Ferruginibacter sp.]|nr:gliding motility-associated C-terminal domain-containing protein [Ferruginibacter sp.]